SSPTSPSPPSCTIPEGGWPGASRSCCRRPCASSAERPSPPRARPRKALSGWWPRRAPPSSATPRHLGEPTNELWLSPISVWEVLILAERGRLELDRPPRAWVDHQLGAG